MVKFKKKKDRVKHTRIIQTLTAPVEKRASELDGVENARENYTRYTDDHWFPGCCFDIPELYPFQR